MAETSKRETYVLFAVVVLACALGSLTQTVMNSMLGGVEADFGVTAAVGQWLTTIYMLMMGITVPAVTYMSQRFSTRGLVVISLVLFIVGGLMAFVAPTFLVLVLARVLQAIAAGITLPLLQAIAMTRFPKSQVGTAMGIAGIAMGFAPNIGPLIGGALVDTLGWRSFYVMLVVFSAVLLVVTYAGVGRGEAPAGGSAVLELVSLLLSTLGFGGVLLGFSNAANMSFSSPLVWVPCIIGIVCLVLFLQRQRRIEHPLISLRIFDYACYRASFVAQNLLYACFMGITLIVPLCVQGLMGMTALEAGIVFVPSTILAIFINPAAGVLMDKVGARPVCVGGCVLLVVGAVAMVFVSADTPLWLLTVMQMVRGMGVSFTIGPLCTWGLKGLPYDITMDGSAFFTAVRQACASIGTALMVLVIEVCGSWAAAGIVGTALAYRLAFGLSALFAIGMFVTVLWKVRD